MATSLFSLSLSLTLTIDDLLIYAFPASISSLIPLISSVDSLPFIIIALLSADELSELPKPTYFPSVDFPFLSFPSVTVEPLPFKVISSET